MLLRQIFDPYLAQYSYLIGCQRTGEALIIDPERDIDRYDALALENALHITAVAETHIHADFVSGAREFCQQPDLHLHLSAEGGADWSYQWPADRANTHWLKHRSVFHVGNIRIEAVHTPGHTPEHLCFLITDEGGGANEPIALVTGDFLFVGGVGRPDLLESAAGIRGIGKPSAQQLQKSLTERLTNFADYVQILPAHGAGSACGKSLGAVPTSTLGYERRFNAPLKMAQSHAEQFVDEILSGQPEPPPYFAMMKRVNRDGIAITNGVPMSSRLSAQEFSEIAAKPQVQVLDARANGKAFDAAHFPGSIYAPLPTPFFSVAAGSYLEADQPILLIVEREADLDLAVRQLYRIGFDRFAGWISASEAAAAHLLSAQIERLDFGNFNSSRALAHGRILDVRTSAEFGQGHLDGSVSIPYTRLKLRLAELTHDQLWYVHCGSGKRAVLAAAYLKAKGFDAVHVDGICEECAAIARHQQVVH